MSKATVVMAVVAIALTGCATSHDAEKPTHSAEGASKEGYDDLLVRRFRDPVPCGVNVFVGAGDAISVDYEPVPTADCPDKPAPHLKTLSWALHSKQGYTFDTKHGIAFRQPFPGGKKPQCAYQSAVLFQCVILDTSGLYTYSINLRLPNGDEGPSLDPRVINN